MEAMPPVSKWMARLYELEGKPLPNAPAKIKPSLDAGKQALIKAYNGALKEPVLLAVAEEYQSLWGCEKVWVVPTQKDKEEKSGRDSLAFTQEELFEVIDAIMASKDGAHALIQAYRMAGGRIEKVKREEPIGKE